jgi:parvulin-like peptidyl-prolyl isomerase
VKFNTNLAAFSTQTSESFNPKIHKIVNHQMSLQVAAQAIVSFTKSFFSTFSNELKRQAVENVAGLNTKVFALLQGQITHEALRLVRTQ